jgi:ribokinase
VREVVVVGDVCVDVVARPVRAVRAGTDTEAAIRVTGGGAGANVAAWLATLGVPVTLVARVGDDPSGRAQAAELAALGVRCAFAVDAHAPTGTIVSLVDPTGERAMLADRGANLGLRPADLPAALPSGAHLHLSGYTLLHPGPRDAGLAAIAMARAAGLTISVDPASVAPLAATGAADFLHWTGGADLLLPNESEAALLSGHPDPDTAATALAARYGAVALTLGPHGALLTDAGHLVRVAAEPVAEVVDSTGAGDAFSAGLLSAWLAGTHGTAALHAGTRTAARAITHLGARPPTSTP